MFPSLWNFSCMTGCEIFVRVVFFIDVAEKSNDPGKFLTPQVACNPKQLLTLLGGEGIFFFFLILSKRSQMKISEQFLQGPLGIGQTAAREVDQGQQVVVVGSCTESHSLLYGGP